ncbi:YqiJ family protein [Pseudobacteriovorax antillogorgiicola]|uniref:Membrane protein implicated in regulation of membrane protease activity n=1 Tax=Pseudobacteriovorax antillogorgiicola TaxID=1513793 RepID=A0A1Y6BJ45_9BACT|nr:YqiJ family protein [Pseudobacteriovorax antillogorgiicola]TCS56377.1 uncharacterized protein DUF1449 [Pseudobacteriovorax antillogorgiicola]SMF06453.1 Protein of unknown function [Pseudobacteriovorax antillogorgiicola]
MEFLLHDSNVLFTASLTVVCLIFTLELLGLILGTGFLSSFEAMIEIDLGSTPVIENGLSLFHIRKIPSSFLIVLFFLCFGLSGYLLHGITIGLFGFDLPVWVSWLPALILAVPMMTIGSALIAKIMPQDESSAVERSSFVGKIATITLGTAKANNPAQAKLKDEHGQTHYIMIEPEQQDECWSQGEHVIVLSQKGSSYIGFKDNSIDWKIH